MEKRKFGPAQISISTAIKSGLLDISKDSIVGGFISPDMYQSANVKYMMAVRNYLNNSKNNINFAAILLRKYFDDICLSAQNGKISQTFLSFAAPGCEVSNFCCRSNNCTEIVEMEIPRCLAGAMAGIWNNGFENAINISQKTLLNSNNFRFHISNMEELFNLIN